MCFLFCVTLASSINQHIQGTWKNKNLSLLLLFGCRWVVNPVAAVIQYGTTNNILKQIHTTTNDTYHTRQHKCWVNSLKQNTKTAHTIIWITTQNEYSHNCINIEISIAIHWGVPVTGYVIAWDLPFIQPTQFTSKTSLQFNSLNLISRHFTSLHFTSPHLTSPHLTSPHITSPHLTSPHLTSPHLTSPHFTSSHFTSLYFTCHVFKEFYCLSAPHKTRQQ
jgi:hypothetical protein